MKFFIILFLLPVLAMTFKEVKLSIRFFEPFGRSRVFHLFLGTFEEVEHHPGPLGNSEDSYAHSNLYIYGSNETMQNALTGCPVLRLTY